MDKPKTAPVRSVKKNPVPQTAAGMPKFESEQEDENEFVAKKKKLKVVNLSTKQVEEMVNLNEDIADLFAGRDNDIVIPVRPRVKQE